MSSVAPEMLDIVAQITELTEAGRLVWRESSTFTGGHSVEVSLASGQWRLARILPSGPVQVQVRDENGTLLYDFEVAHNDTNYAAIQATYDAATKRNRSEALAKMREELAAR